MKTKPIALLVSLAIFSMMLLAACESDDGSIVATKIETFVSLGGDDGYIENLSNRVVHDFYSHSQGKSLLIGWNATGHSMRSFISFDVSDIMPGSNRELIIDEAILKVYESNTNMHPFDGAGTRVVNCFMVMYGSLDASAYDLIPLADCGTIATWGYNVLKEYPLNLTTTLNNFLKTYPTFTKFQFRLQFIPDGNVNLPSPLSSGIWAIFSGDETARPDYRPQLTIKYHYKNKE
ncbi:MAG: hypothetical protein K0B09_04455 [Bacteroidales bacterium]|nr:hypothetical protein [Bacteroidales bacterium]